MSKRINRTVSLEQTKQYAATEQDAMNLLARVLMAAPTQSAPTQSSPTQSTAGPRIDEMLDQIGVRKTTGPYVCSGGRGLTYADPNRNGLGKSDGSLVTQDGLIEAGCHVRWQVNAGRRQRTMIYVTLESDDTYTVRLWQKTTQAHARKTGVYGKVLYENTDVYCYNLSEICASVYDKFLQDHCDGFLPL